MASQRCLMKATHYLFASALVTATACHSREPNDEAGLMPPASWESFAQERPACTGIAAQDSGWTSWVLDRPRSVLRLPPTAREVARARRPDYREWELPDSGGVEVWITDDPALGMAVTQPWKIQLETECRLSIAGHPGDIFQYSAVKDGQSDTSLRC